MALLDNLISYYKLDENSADTTVLDSRGANNGTASTNTENLSVAGKIISAFDFDGSSEGISGVYEVGASFSVSMWIMRDTLGSTGFIYAKDDGIANDDIQFRVTSHSTDVFRFNLGNTINAIFTADTTTALSSGVWYHVVCTFNGTTMKIYLNGNEEGTDTFSGTRVAAGSETYLARRGNGDYFDGKIDEVGMWSRELTSSEVTELYNSGNGLAYPFEDYKQTRSAGNLKLGKGLFGKERSKLFNKATASGEIEIKTSTGSTQKIIDINSSYNSSTTQITKTTTTYTSMISKSHKSNTGKVMVIAQAPVVVQTANGDINLRLTKTGTLIPGAEILGLWSSGDGVVSFALMGFTEVDIDKSYTYALQWAQSDSELDFMAGGTLGSYNILIQDII